MERISELVLSGGLVSYKGTVFYLVRDRITEKKVESKWPHRGTARLRQLRDTSFFLIWVMLKIMKPAKNQPGIQEKGAI